MNLLRIKEKKETRLIAYTNIDTENQDVNGLHTKNVKSLIKVIMLCIQRRRERGKKTKWKSYEKHVAASRFAMCVYGIAKRWFSYFQDFPSPVVHHSFQCLPIKYIINAYHNFRCCNVCCIFDSALCKYKSECVSKGNKMKIIFHREKKTLIHCVLRRLEVCILFFFHLFTSYS